MAPAKLCSRDDCPPANVKSETTINCAQCKQIIHLPCIGILLKKEQLASPNVKILCNKCVSDPTPITTATQIMKQNSKTSVNQQPSIFDATANKKLDELLKLTREINENLIGNKNSPTINNNQKSFASVLREIHETTGNVKKNIEEMKSKPQQLSTPSLNQNTPRPPLSNMRSTVKRRRIENVNTPPSRTPSLMRNQIDESKAALKNRRLITGTGKLTNHNLGKAVVSSKEKKMSSSPSITAKYEKSMYASRFETSISPSEIESYIKSQISEVNENDFTVRMLVKKDQNMEILTFVSFRITCTNELYTKIMHPDFWPSGILIGEFFERKSSQRHTLADFMPSINKNNHATKNIDPNQQPNTAQDNIEQMEQSHQPQEN